MKIKKYEKIVINGRFVSQKLTGVQRYALEITKALDKLLSSGDYDIPKTWGGYNSIVELVIPQNVCETKLPSLSSIKIKKIGKHSGILWEQFDLAHYIKKNKALALHLCNCVPFFSPKGIACVHDITYKVNPEFITTKHLFLARLWHLFQYRLAIKKSIFLTTVSAFSKNEILKHYRIKENKIFVIYNAHQHFNTKVEGPDTLQNFPQLVDNQYYFSLATMAKNKNFSWILQAAKLYPNSTFAVAGNIDITKLGDNLSSNCEALPKNLITLGYISDNDAKILMKHCKAFIFPSLYEGFGIPPLEALSMGAKVICSTSSCLPEIFMDCVYYIDPHKPCPPLKELLSQKVCDKEKVLNAYSWEKSAKQYWDLLSLILK